jgi:plasmid stability protein
MIMPVNLTIKGLPDGLYDALKNAADSNRRSINSEVIVRLETALKPRPSVKETLESIRKLRESLPQVPITDREINRAKRQGRP